MRFLLLLILRSGPKARVSKDEVALISLFRI
jgi:hypothetical protein